MDEERALLLDQLDELLSEGIEDEEEALEAAALAGMLERAGGSAEELADVRAWRDGLGAELLAEAFDALDLDAYVDALDACTYGESADEEVEEAVWDLDEVAAAAVFCGRTPAVLPALRRAERLIRELPDAFAPLYEDAARLVRQPAVGRELDVYGFWLAIAEAGPAEE
jgi:hypothetical protein